MMCALEEKDCSKALVEPALDAGLIFHGSVVGMGVMVRAGTLTIAPRKCVSSTVSSWTGAP